MRKLKRRTGWEMDPGPNGERPTLLTCEACDGKLSQELESNISDYRSKQCQWCDGIGGYTRSRQVAYKRWRSIVKHWHSRGLCG